MSEPVICIADADATECRIDSWLSEQFPDVSRTYMQRVLKDGGVTVNDAVVKASYRMKEDDRVSVLLPEKKEPGSRNRRRICRRKC